MKPFLWMLCLLGLSARGQIELPDYLAPGGGEDDRSDATIDPVERRHVDESEEAGEEEDEAFTEDDSKQWIARMQGRNIQVTVDSLEKEDGAAERYRRIEDFYMGGPEEVTLVIESRRGRVFQSILPNQTLLVETEWGKLPVRLHEIEEGGATEAEDGFAFELTGGDKVEGRLPDVHFWMKRMDGSERMIPGRDIRRLRIVR